MSNIDRKLFEGIMVLQSYYPTGGEMSRKRMVINMSVSPELYSMINSVAAENEINRSELLRRSLKQYIASERSRQPHIGMCCGRKSGLHCFR